MNVPPHTTWSQRLPRSEKIDWEVLLAGLDVVAQAGFFGVAVLRRNRHNREGRRNARVLWWSMIWVDRSGQGAAKAAPVKSSSTRTT